MRVTQEETAEKRPIWVPQPKQAIALVYPVTEIFFGGARGGGKTDYLLAAFVKHLLLNGNAARGILFRKSYPELEEVNLRAQELFPRIGGVYGVQSRTWRFPLHGGGLLRLRYITSARDAAHYQGHSYSWIAFDEVTNWETPEPIDMLRGCFRSKTAVEKKFLLTGNPGGPGHNWVKSRYIDPAPPMKPFDVIGRDGKPAGRAVFIPSRLQDNRELLSGDPGYADRLRLVGSEQLVKAWLDGDWDIVAGGMYDDVWRREHHVVSPHFDPPQSWYCFRSFDWGSAKPFSVGWWARSDGSTTKEGVKYPAGTLYRFAEWYGWNGRPNEGIRMLAHEIAAGIREREEEFKRRAGVTVHAGPADPSIYDDINGVSIGREMEKAGVAWRRGINAPGSRKTRCEIMRRRLKAMVPPRDGGSDGNGACGNMDTAREWRPEEPGLIVSETCVDGWIRTIPVIQRDPKKIDDVDTASEDHVHDEAGMALMFAETKSKTVRLTGN